MQRFKNYKATQPDPVLVNAILGTLYGSLNLNSYKTIHCFLHTNEIAEPTYCCSFESKILESLYAANIPVSSTLYIRSV